MLPELNKTPLSSITIQSKSQNLTKIEQFITTKLPIIEKLTTIYLQNLPSVTMPKERVTIRTTTQKSTNSQTSTQKPIGNAAIQKQLPNNCPLISKQCHQLASCQPETNSCVCNKGSIGDGYTSCA
jgi:hypothetical protein